MGRVPASTAHTHTRGVLLFVSRWYPMVTEPIRRLSAQIPAVQVTHLCLKFGLMVYVLGAVDAAAVGASSWSSPSDSMVASSTYFFSN